MGFRRYQESGIQLESGEREGPLPVEEEDQDSLTVRVVKADGGAVFYIRFNRSDRWKAVELEGPESEVIAELCDMFKSFATGLLKTPKGKKKLGPGRWQYTYSGRSPESSPEQMKIDLFSAFATLETKGLKLTLDNVAPELLSPTGDALGKQLKPLGGFRALLGEYRKRRK